MSLTISDFRFGIFRLRSSLWDPWSEILLFGIFGLRSSVWDLRFANIALRCSVLNSLLRSSFWDLGLGVFRCVILGLGRWAPEVGGTAWRQLEAHGQGGGVVPTPEILRTLWLKLIQEITIFLQDVICIF